MPFLSLLDNRAKPKGSRDPLGFEMVWTHYGRQVIGNLTTITSSLNNFAVASLGFAWANEMHSHLPEYQRQASIRDTFLRFEQLTGYLRYLAGDRSIMGITRISTRLDNDENSVSFGMAADQQILSDQASYGLWGLYSAAMRETGLVRGDDRMPTDLGHAIAGEIGARLDKTELLKLLSGTRKIDTEDLAPYAKSFRAAINKKKMQQKLLHALMNGSPQKFIQQEMWRVTQALAEAKTPVTDLPGFIDRVKRKTRQPELEQKLTQIESVERLLVAANNIFHYCRRKDGEPVASLLQSLTGRYDYSHLPTHMDFNNVPRADLLTRILAALQADKIGDALTHILELNRVVMDQRGGAPWVEIENGKTLRVRVPSEKAELRDQAYLDTGWDYDYFLSSFIQMASTGLGAQWTLR